MSVIVPAILSSSREDIEGKLAQLSKLTVDSVQIDVVDGVFAPSTTWPYSEEETSLDVGETFPYLGQISYEVDLMVQNPEKVIASWISAGASKITIHAKSTNYIGALLKNIRTTYGHDKDFAPDLLSIGIALDINADIAILDPFIDQIEYVQFMGIADIGVQGEPFDSRVLDKVRMWKRRNPSIPIQVDGGVSLMTASALLDAGVSKLIVGSALWRAPHLDVELRKFTLLAEEHGIYT
ncbi:hypothetical protein KKH15_01720 [Patescibacteria group bacterium]|nr:hypothetical protein [Patescibacteria group bacterium]MBU1755069.1 hypothetical protein [Patescibacteria group bacterium]